MPHLASSVPPVGRCSERPRRKEGRYAMTTMDEARTGSAERPDAGGVAPQGVELRHLRYFVALADAGTFPRAAERMFIAQPTLSQQIRRLEELVGAPLLQRRRDGMRLTEAGSVLLEESRGGLSRVDHGGGRAARGCGSSCRRACPRTWPSTWPCGCGPRPKPPVSMWPGSRRRWTGSSPRSCGAASMPAWGGCPRGV